MKKKLMLTILILITPALIPSGAERGRTDGDKSGAPYPQLSLFFSPPVLWAEDAANGGTPGGEKLIAVNLGEASLREFVVFVRDELGLQLEYDVSIFPQEKQPHYFGFLPKTRDELFALFKETLDLYGYDVITTGEGGNLVYHILRKTDTPKVTPVPMEDGVDEHKIAFERVQLEYADAAYIVSQISKIAATSPQTVVEVPETNAVLIKGTPNTIRYIKGIIKGLDVKEAAPVTEVVHLRYVAPARMMEIVNAHLGIVKGGELQGSKGGRKSSVVLTPVEKPNSIIVTASQRDAAFIVDFINKFDVEIKYPEQEIVTREYLLEYVNPQEVADIISEIFQVPGPLVVGAKETAPENGKSAPAAEATQPPPEKDRAVLVPFGREDYEKPTIVIQKGRSAIIVTTSNRMHDKIAELVKMLDKRVPQVFLQAALVSIAYDTDLSIVTELSTVERTTSGDKGFGVTDFGLSKLTPVPGFILQGRADFRKGGLTFGITHGNANIIPVLVRISKTDSRVNVISMPSVMADNDQKAEFSTQDSAPVTQRTTQSDGSISDTFGAYQTAAIKIAITPTILKGERLRLDVTLLVEAFTDTQASPQVPPPKTSNSFTGIITVPDQKTIVVGGLVSERDSLVESKVPILGDIPILGLLFKSKTKIKAKGVLYVFITPRILRSQDTSDDDTLTKEKQDEIDKAKEKAGFGAKK